MDRLLPITLQDDYFRVKETKEVTEGRILEKWVVKVIDLEGNVREEHLNVLDLWTMKDDRVILEFGPHNQPEGGSGRIFGTWLGQYSISFCRGYRSRYDWYDWSKVPEPLKDLAWEHIQKVFYFDASDEKYKKFVMKRLSQKCKANNIWRMKPRGRKPPIEIIEYKKITPMDSSDLYVVRTKEVTERRKREMWLVKVKEIEGHVREEYLTAHDIWDLEDGRVILEFGPHNQPEGESGGLFGTWLGLISIEFCNGSLSYEDWRKIEKGKKDAAWETIQEKFYFDASNEKYKKFVMKSLSHKCKAHKIWLMKACRRETLEETIADGPDDIPEEDWSAFVYLQFSDGKKKVSERNAKSRSCYKTPHTLGKKSIARKSKEILLKEGKRPSRAEMFVLSRKSQRSDKDFVSEEARVFSKKLKEKMTQNTGNTSENNITNDVFAQVFGAERPGRVRCVGLGPTPSTFFKNDTASTSTETEVIDLRNRVTYLENKLERLDELEALIASMKGTNG